MGPIHYPQNEDKSSLIFIEFVLTFLRVCLLFLVCKHVKKTIERKKGSLKLEMVSHQMVFLRGSPVFCLNWIVLLLVCLGVVR